MKLDRIELYRSGTNKFLNESLDDFNEIENLIVESIKNFGLPPLGYSFEVLGSSFEIVNASICNSMAGDIIVFYVKQRPAKHI